MPANHHTSINFHYLKHHHLASFTLFSPKLKEGKKFKIEDMT